MLSVGRPTPNREKERNSLSMLALFSHKFLRKNYSHSPGGERVKQQKENRGIA